MSNAPASYVRDLKLVSIVTCGEPPHACMVVTLINTLSQQVFTLPAVNLGADNFCLRNQTHFRGLKALLEVLGFTVEDVILGEMASDDAEENNTSNDSSFLAGMIPPHKG